MSPSNPSSPDIPPGPIRGILPNARPGSLSGIRNPPAVQSTHPSPRTLVNPAHWDGNSAELPAPFAPLDLPPPDEYFKRKVALISGMLPLSSF